MAAKLTDDKTEFCHSIFALSLAHFAFRHSRGINFVRLMAAKLTDNKTEFCHSDRMGGISLDMISLRIGMTDYQG